MAAKRSSANTGGSTVRLARARKIIAVALLRSISEQGSTNAGAARLLLVSERTVYAWTHCERPVDVEVVLACPQLAPSFRQHLCSHDHDSVPYVAPAGKRPRAT